MSSRQVTALVDLDAISSNFNLVRHHAPNSCAMAIMKADAYGHGAIRVAQSLPAADAFGVARVSEAVELREAGIGQPICLLEGVNDREELNLASIFELQVVIHDQSQLELLERSGARRKIWLKIDTGMGRLGFSPETVPEVLASLGKQTLLGVMTHLSEASDPSSTKTDLQLMRLQEVIGNLEQPGAKTLSIANSAGILGHAASLADWVRPGLMLYGATPFDDLKPMDELHPAMTFSAPVIAVHTVKAGESVGYGGIFTAAEDTRVAVIAAGYADGYPREIAQGAPILLHGERRKLVGNVSMDMICVELEPSDVVQPSDRAVLWGEGLAIEEIAALCGTIPYTLMTGVSSRVYRHYRVSN